MVVFLLLALITLSVQAQSIPGTLFKTTNNISEINFEKSVKKTTTVDGHLQCTHFCAYWERKYGYCNAYSIDGPSCKIVKLCFLEEIIRNYSRRERETVSMTTLVCSSSKLQPTWGVVG